MFFKKSYKSLSDSDLMRHIAKQKEGAFAELYDRYNVRMHRYFYRSLWQNEQMAEDFTQDLFLKIIDKPERFDPTKNFKTWCYTVASNMVKNAYRSHARKPKFTAEIPDLAMPENKGKLSEVSDRQFFQKELQKALEKLDEIPRQCFVLRFQEELSIREISVILNCPEGTVKSRIFYTLRKLAKDLAIFSFLHSE